MRDSPAEERLLTAWGAPGLLLSSGFQGWLAALWVVQFAAAHRYFLGPLCAAFMQ